MVLVPYSDSARVLTSYGYSAPFPHGLKMMNLKYTAM